MAQVLTIHPSNPQPRLLRLAAQILRGGGVIAYPTDSTYALGCRLDDAEATRRIRAIRALNERHHLTLMCRDLSEIANYAIVDDARFRRGCGLSRRVGQHGQSLAGQHIRGRGADSTVKVSRLFATHFRG